jgi:hypothetical protein
MQLRHPPGNNIALIVAYMGKLPAYFQYFAVSLSKNRNLKLFMFTDQAVKVPRGSENIVIVGMTMAEFNRLATAKLGRPVHVRKAYKLCDLKPMYGAIFSDFLGEYEFWGHCDTDMIFGDTSKVLTDDLLNNNDIISGHPQYISGPFTLYRNTPEINATFEKSRDVEKVLAAEQNLYFDEAGSAIAKLWAGYKITDIESDIESITHLVQNHNKFRGRAKFTTLLTEWLPDDIQELSWSDGRLTDLSGPETFLFHYLIYKTSIFFNAPPLRDKIRFTFTKRGFFTEDPRSYSIDWASCVIATLSTKATRKIQRIFRERLERPL